VSRQGGLLWIEHPYGGNRPMAHVFDLASGGVGWVDHGWTDGLYSGHPCHIMAGEVRAAGDGSWTLTAAEEALAGRAIVIRPPGRADPDGMPDGDRTAARRAIEVDLEARLLPDDDPKT
jgi:hypothetical protein